MKRGFKRLFKLWGYRPAPIGPSSTDYEAWLKTRPNIAARFCKHFSTHSGYEIWRNAWMACEREHGIRK
jgi:hypothetical protein